MEITSRTEASLVGGGKSSALTASNSQHVLGKILVRLLTMRTIQELKQGEYSVTSGTLQNASALR